MCNRLMGRMALLISSGTYLISYVVLKRNPRPSNPPSKNPCLPFCCLLTHVQYIYQLNGTFVSYCQFRPVRHSFLMKVLHLNVVLKSDFKLCESFFSMTESALASSVLGIGMVVKLLWALIWTPLKTSVFPLVV